MILQRYEKQPAEVKDYDVDYTAWLSPQADTIAAATAVAVCTSGTDATLEIDSIAFTEDTVKVWISGGTSGETYKVTITVTTAGGRVDESELVFKVRDR